MTISPVNYNYTRQQAFGAKLDPEVLKRILELKNIAPKFPMADLTLIQKGRFQDPFEKKLPSFDPESLDKKFQPKLPKMSADDLRSLKEQLLEELQRWISEKNEKFQPKLPNMGADDLHILEKNNIKKKPVE